VYRNSNAVVTFGGHAPEGYRSRLDESGCLALPCCDRRSSAVKAKARVDAFSERTAFTSRILRTRQWRVVPDR